MSEKYFGVIVSSRRFFNSKLALEGREKLLRKLDELGFKYVVLSTQDTEGGVVASVEDAVKCANLFKANRDRIKGIIVSLPNFGDEVAVSTAIKLSELNVPVLVHGFNDDMNKMEVENRRDAFCGKISVCNNLYQMGIKFTNTTLHTCDVGDSVFEEDLKNFDSICNIVDGLRNINILQLGTRPAPFKTVRYSEKLLQRYGINVIPVDLSEVIAYANSLDANSSVVKENIERIKNYGYIENEEKEKVEKSAKLLAAIEYFVRTNDCKAGAIQCWESIQNNYGTATCLPMSILTENGVPFACETDIMGAVSMLILYYASGIPAGYVDWNNNYDNDPNKCIAFHCSAYAKSFLGKKPSIGTLEILGATLGYDKCFGCIKGRIAKGDMTYFKLSTDDIKGKIKGYVGEGEFTDDPVNTCGAYGVCYVPKLQELMRYICENGFEHHVAMGRGKVAKAINEAINKYLGWDIYWHQ